MNKGESIRYNSTQYVTLDKSGLYMIESYGGKGGNSAAVDCVNDHWQAGASGGNGGYAKGYYAFNKGTNIQVVVGAKGTTQPTWRGYNSGTGYNDETRSTGTDGGNTYVKYNNQNLAIGYGGEGAESYVFVGGGDYSRSGQSKSGDVSKTPAIVWKGTTYSPSTTKGASSNAGYLILTLVDIKSSAKLGDKDVSIYLGTKEISAFLGDKEL